MRYVYTAVGIVLLVGALVAIKATQIGQLIGFGEAAAADGPPPETVMTARAQTRPVERTLDAVGTVTSAQGVKISTEVAGVVTKLGFDSGDTVTKGQVLAQLDTRVERAQLAQAKARLALAKTSLGQTQKLVPAGAAPEFQLDSDRSSFEAAGSEVDSLRAQLAKKTIRAPFSGRLGIRAVDIGQYLSPGTELTALETVDEAYVDFALPQRHLSQVSVGMAVRITLEGEPPLELMGTLEAIDPSLNANTRSLQLRASVDATQDALRPGMFANVEVILGDPKPQVMVPATAISHASYGDSVFVVEGKPEDEPGVRETKDGLTVQLARQQFVKLGPARGDFVAVLDGVTDGQIIVAAGVFKLRNGAPIVVNNDVDLDASLAPSVPNR